jgi:ABC-2 type transport system permease protein
MVFVFIFLVISLTLTYTNIHKINGILYKNKDNDLLFSLPLKKSEILYSRLANLYIFNFLIMLILFIPALVIYILKLGIVIKFLFIFFISLLFIPLIPICISLILGTIISYISSKFEKGNIVEIILLVLITFFIIYINYKLGSSTNLDVFNISMSLTKTFSAIYPVTYLYEAAINQGKLLYLLYFILINTFIFLIFTVLLNKYYLNLSLIVGNKKKRKVKVLKIKKTKSLYKTLIKKEAKRFFASSIYVVNSMFGILTLLVLSLYVYYGGINKVLSLLGAANFEFSKIPFFISILVSISCMTYASISIEGKNLWIIKSLPLKPIHVINTKILLNLILVLPITVLSVLFLSIALKLNFMITIFSFIIPILMVILAAVYGIFFNLLLPNFEWKNEIIFIKQSAPAFIMLIVGMTLNIFLILLNHNLNIVLFNSMVVVIFILLIIVIYMYLYKNSEKLFMKL